MPDPECRGHGHRPEHVGRVEVPDDQAVADVGPRRLADEGQLDALVGRKSQLLCDREAGAVEQRDEADDELGHRSNLAAVTTLWATS